MTQHYCSGQWQDGPVGSCAKHEKNQKRRPVRMGRIARGKADKATGVVGKQSITGGHYNG